jgi:hypothetical protein
VNVKWEENSTIFGEEFFSSLMKWLVNVWTFIVSELRCIFIFLICFRQIDQGLAELILKDDQGRPKLALTVFADSICYLKKEMFAVFEKQGMDVLSEEVRFVVTVPAIWDDGSRGFMINAAIEVSYGQ